MRQGVKYKLLVRFYFWWYRIVLHNWALGPLHYRHGILTRSITLTLGLRGLHICLTWPRRIRTIESTLRG